MCEVGARKQRLLEMQVEQNYGYSVMSKEQIRQVLSKMVVTASRVKERKEVEMSKDVEAYLTMIGLDSSETRADPAKVSEAVYMRCALVNSRSDRQRDAIFTLHCHVMCIDSFADRSGCLCSDRVLGSYPPEMGTDGKLRTRSILLTRAYARMLYMIQVLYKHIMLCISS